MVKVQKLDCTLKNRNLENLEPNITLNQMSLFQSKSKRQKISHQSCSPSSSQIQSVLKRLNEHSRSVNKLKAETRNMLKSVSEENLEEQKQIFINLSQTLKNMQEKYQTNLKKYVNKIKKSDQSLLELQERNEYLEAAVKHYKRKIKNLKAVIFERKNIENVENISVGTQTQSKYLKDKANKGITVELLKSMPNIKTVSRNTQTQPKYFKNTSDKGITANLSKNVSNVSVSTEIQSKYLKNTADKGITANLFKNVSKASIGTQIQLQNTADKETSTECADESSMDTCESTAISEVQNIQQFEETSDNLYLPEKRILQVFGPMCQQLVKLESNFNVKIKIKSLSHDFKTFIVIITGHRTCIGDAKTFILRKSFDITLRKIMSESYRFERQAIQKFRIRCNTRDEFFAMDRKVIAVAKESGAQVRLHPSLADNCCFAVVIGLLSKIEYAIYLLFAELGELEPVDSMEVINIVKKLSKEQIKELKKSRNNSKKILRCQNTKKNQNNNQKQNNKKVQHLEKSNILNVPSSSNQSIPVNGFHASPNLPMDEILKTTTANINDDVVYFSPEKITK